MNNYIKLNGVYDENEDMIPLYSENGKILGSISSQLFEDFNNIKEKLVVGEVLLVFSTNCKMSGDFIRETVSRVEEIGLHKNLSLILMDAISLYENGSIPLTEENIARILGAYYKEVGSGYLRLMEICNNPDLYKSGNIGARLTNSYTEMTNENVGEFYLDSEVVETATLSGGAKETFLSKSYLVSNDEDEELTIDEDELEEGNSIKEDIEIVDRITSEEMEVLLGSNPASTNADSNFLQLEEEEELILEDSEDEIILEPVNEDLIFGQIEEEKITLELVEEDTLLSDSNLEEIKDQLVFDTNLDEEDDELLIPEPEEVELEDDEEDEILEEEFVHEESLLESDNSDEEFNQPKLEEEDSESDTLFEDDFDSGVKEFPQILDKSDVVTNIHRQSKNELEEETKPEVEPIAPIAPIDPFDSFIQGLESNEGKEEPTKEEPVVETVVEKEPVKIEPVVEPVKVEPVVEVIPEPAKVEIKQEPNQEDLIKLFENKMEEILTKTTQAHQMEVSKLEKQIESLTGTIEKLNTEKVKPVEIKSHEQANDSYKVKPITPFEVNENTGRNNRLIKSAHEEKIAIYEPKIESKILGKSVNNSNNNSIGFDDDNIGYVFQPILNQESRKSNKLEGMNKIERERRELARQVLISKGVL